MPLHPADGPRLKTVYVTHSTRKRKRRTNSRRRRRNALIFAVLVTGCAAAGGVFHEKIGQQFTRLVLRKHGTTWVRDVTAPQPASRAVPALLQAGTPSAVQVQQPAAAH